MTEERKPGAIDRVWASEFARMAAKEEAQRKGLSYPAEAARNDEIMRDLLDAVESGALLVYVPSGSAEMIERKVKAKEPSFPRGDFPLKLDSAQRWLRGEPQIDPAWRDIDDLFIAIEETEKEIQYWKSRDDSIPSEAKIIKAELVPLEAKLAFLLERKRSMRGDDLVTVPTAVEGEAASTSLATPVIDMPARNAPLRMGNSTKEVRENDLTPAIKLAQDKCNDPFNNAEVWPALLALAMTDERPPVLLGTTSVGVTYRVPGGHAILSKKNLGDRLRREREKASKLGSTR